MLTLILSVSLIVGGVFALFTSESKVNIAVTSGRIDVKASVRVTKIESLEATDGDTFDREDGEGGRYSFKDVTESGAFLTGGTATVNGGALNVSGMMPGDRLTLSVDVRNDSSVSAKYRVKIEVDEAGYALASGMVTQISGEEKEGVIGYVSAWKELINGTDYSEEIVLELPVDRGNGYQGLTAEYTFTVEAVQGNARATGEERYEYANITPMTSRVATTERTEGGNTSYVADATSITVVENEGEEGEIATTVELESGWYESDANDDLNVVLTVETFDREGVDELDGGEFTAEIGNEVIGAIDINLLVNGRKVSSFNDTRATVTAQLETGLDGVTVYYNGEALSETDDGENDYYRYYPETGKLVIKTSHFSKWLITANLPNWRDYAAENYEANDEENKSLEISTAEEFALFAQDVNGGKDYDGWTVTLGNDIDLGGKEWSPIGNSQNGFKGVFDGKGHTISNLYIGGNTDNNSRNNFHGLFGKTLSPAVITNFTMDNVVIRGSLYVGAAVGMAYTGKEISNVTVKGDVDINGWWYVGGISGNGYVQTIKNCHVKANEGSKVYASGSYVGGIHGFRGEGGQTIEDCTSNVNVEAFSYVGGISGILHYGNTIKNCTATGNVTKTGTEEESDDSDLYGIGGIAGISVDGTTATIENCVYEGKLNYVSGGIVNGGVIGNNRNGTAANNLVIKNCTVNGERVDNTETEEEEGSESVSE